MSEATPGAAPPVAESDHFAWRIVAQAALVTLLCGFYTLFFWTPDALHVEFGLRVEHGANLLITRLLHVPPIWRWAIRSCVFVLTAVLLVRAAGYRQYFLLFPRIPAWGSRLLGTALVFSAPFLLWVGTRPGVHHYYRAMNFSNAPSRLLANAVNILSEHVFVQGLFFALALPAFLLPPPVDPPRRGRLASLGLGRPEGGGGISAWLGVPLGAWPAMIGSAVLFSFVHLGKDWSEVATALPGGLALAWLTLRLRSIWPGLLLHWLTGFLVVLTIFATRPG
jgi:hypothetical protein